MRKFLLLLLLFSNTDLNELNGSVITSTSAKNKLIIIKTVLLGTARILRKVLEI